jgi:hypothetical protein
MQVSIADRTITLTKRWASSTWKRFIGMVSSGSTGRVRAGTPSRAVGMPHCRIADASV